MMWLLLVVLDGSAARCAAGSRSLSGNHPCYECPAGTANPTGGNDFCRACLKGTIAKNKGRVSCL